MGARSSASILDFKRSQIKALYELSHKVLNVRLAFFKDFRWHKDYQNGWLSAYRSICFFERYRCRGENDKVKIATDFGIKLIAKNRSFFYKWNFKALNCDRVEHYGQCQTSFTEVAKRWKIVDSYYLKKNFGHFEHILNWKDHFRYKYDL